MIFHWSLSDSKSPQVSKTLLSILAVLNNVVVWIVSTRPQTSKSPSSFSNPLVTVLNAPITIGIIVTFMRHSFFNSLTRSRYLSFFSHSFSFILWSTGTAKSTFCKLSFFFFLIKSGLLAEIRWSECMLKSHRSLCALFSRTCAGLCIYNLFVWIYYYCYYYYFFASFSHQHEWEQVSSNLLDTSQYPSRSNNALVSMVADRLPTSLDVMPFSFCWSALSLVLLLFFFLLLLLLLSLILLFLCKFFFPTSISGWSFNAF